MRWKLDAVISMILLVSLVLVTFLQVLFRFVFNLPLAWSEELSRFLFIFLVYLSASIAVKERASIKIELIGIFLKKRSKVYLDKGIDSICALFSFFMAYQCYFLIKNAFEVGQVTPALGLPVGLLFFVLLLFFSLIGIRYVSLLFIKKEAEDDKIAKKEELPS